MIDEVMPPGMARMLSIVQRCLIVLELMLKAMPMFEAVLLLIVVVEVPPVAAMPLTPPNWSPLTVD